MHSVAIFSRERMGAYGFCDTNGFMHTANPARGSLEHRRMINCDQTNRGTVTARRPRCEYVVSD